MSSASASRYLRGWNCACSGTSTAPATGNGSPVSVTNDAGSPASRAARASARTSSTRSASVTYVYEPRRSHSHATPSSSTTPAVRSIASACDRAYSRAPSLPRVRRSLS